jgi:glycosyltransferase involved in cell wall biosynthesis
VRVLHCTLDYAPRPTGGAEHQAQLQAEELSRRGHDVHVVCARQGRERSGRVGSVQVHRTWRINHRPAQTLTACASLAWFLLRRGRAFDVVHVHLADVRAEIAVLACRLLRRPVYVKVAAGGPRGDIGRQRRIARLTRYYGLRHAASVQAISAEIVTQLEEIGVDRERIAAIPNGFDPAVFHPASDPERTEIRRSLGLPENRLIVLYVGRFARYKGIDDLLEVWPGIASRYAAECVLCGYSAVEDPYTIPKGIAGLTVRPWTSHPELLLRAADIFVQPSHVEGMSNALLEAMACGLPAVATGVGAAPQMIQDGVSGLLVPPGRPADLAGAAERLLADSGLRHSVGEMARDSSHGRYAISAVVDQIEARYAAITSP